MECLILLLSGNIIDPNRILLRIFGAKREEVTG
jgi:hypothetical protein